MTPAELRAAALVPTSWEAPRDWKLTYDKATEHKAITGCSGKKLTPSDLTMDQREWGDEQGAGTGEIAVVLAVSDAPPNTTGNPGYRRGEALAALALADRKDCTHEHNADGSDTALELDGGNVHRPSSGRFSGVDVYCTKTTRKGHPDSHACWTAAGAGDVYVQLYGFGLSADGAARALGWVLEGDAQAFDALPA